MNCASFVTNVPEQIRLQSPTQIEPLLEFLESGAEICSAAFSFRKVSPASTLSRLGAAVRTSGVERLALTEMPSLSQADVVPSLLTACLECREIRELTVGGIEGIHAWRALTNALPKFRHIVRLRIQDSNTDSQGISELAEALSHQTDSLQEIEFMHIVNLSGKGIQLVCSALAHEKRPSESLRKVVFSNLYLGTANSLLAFTAVSGLVTRLSRLESLDLAEMGISSEGAKSIAEALARSRSMRHLELAGNYLGDEGAKALALALIKNESLQELGLWRNDIRTEGAIALGEMLRTNGTLVRLSVRYNYITTKGAEKIANGVELNRTLEELNMSYNADARFGGEMARCIECNRSLKKLDLRFNSLDNDGITLIAAALKQNKTLTNLVLRGSEHIELKNAEQLFLSLQHLDLSYCPLNPREESLIGAAISKSTTLLCLRLRGCRIGDTRLEPILVGAGESRSISELDLGRNDLTSDAAKLIVSALGVPNDKSRLKVLRLSGNRLGDKGAELLGPMLHSERGRQIEKLDLESNKIFDLGAIALAAGIGAGLKRLNVSRNEITDIGAKTLCRAMGATGGHKELRLALNLIQIQRQDEMLGSIPPASGLELIFSD